MLDLTICDRIAAEILAQDSIDVDGNVIPGMIVPHDLVGFAFINIDLTACTGGPRSGGYFELAHDEEGKPYGKPLVDDSTVRGDGPGSGRWLFRLDEVELDPAKDPLRRPVQFHKVGGERAINLADSTPERVARLEAMAARYEDPSFELEIGDPMNFLTKLAQATVEETGERAEWIADLLGQAEPDEEGWEEL